jgi:hypothetical protein
LAVLASSIIFYSPSRLFAMFSAYPELQALAENPVTAQGLVGPNRDRATPEQPRIARQKGNHADPMHWADIEADLSLGVERLTSGGIGVEAIRAQMQGLELDEFARHQGQPLHEVEHHHERAIYKLARRLEPVSSAGGVG